MAAKQSRKVRDPEATQRRILAAAEAEFARKGYDGSRLRDVAEAAGVHHALLHHYFGDKEGLFRAVVERAFGQASTRAFALLDSREGLEPLLERYVETLVDLHADSPGLARLLHFAALDQGSPAYAVCVEMTESIVTPLLERIAAVVSEGQRAGRVRPDIDARRLVALCIGMASYVFHEEGLFSAFLGQGVRTPDGLEAHKDAVVRMLRAAVFVD